MKKRKVEILNRATNYKEKNYEERSRICIMKVENVFKIKMKKKYY